MRRPPLWTAWDPPFLVALFLLSLWAGRASLGPAGVASRIRLQTPEGIRSLPLEPGPVTVQGHLGLHRIRVDEALRVHIDAAPCPAGLCRTLGPISRVGEALICVPNQILLELEGGSEGMELDGVTQ